MSAREPQGSAPFLISGRTRAARQGAGGTVNTTMKAIAKKQPANDRKLSVRERAYLHIHQLLATGRLPAGSAISELQLAKELSSSRTPIREAMNQLAAEGMLEQAPGGGMIVTQITRESINELYELREALEVYAVSRVATVPVGTEDRKYLQELIDGIGKLRKELIQSKESTLSDQQMNNFLTYDLGFHALLMSMTHNGRMQKIINETRLLISVFATRRRGHDAPALASIQRYHQDILDAVIRQDVPAAMHSISEHIRASQMERLQEYDNWRREQALKQTVPALFHLGRSATNTRA